MDVQSDTTDPPSGESQPSGKKKGFKLFGKRKPGSIFSLRSRADEKDHVAVERSMAPDGSPESDVSSPEPEHEGESATEDSGPNGRADAALQDEGTAMMAAGPHRSSICSTGSIRSLSFLLRLRGGKKGGRGDCMAQTVSQPVPGRQRRGIKGLFSNVKFPQNKGQQEDKPEVPSSPLLMSSRSNSVEIIKEDMTLTPRPPLRKNHSSSETEGAERASPVDPCAPVSPSARSPHEPGDAGLSFLLADISSLLTFDSITTGNDIMADVAAEWDKASAAISARDTAEMPATPSPKPVRSSPPTYAPPVTSAAALAANSSRSSTAQKPAAASSLFAQPGAAEFKSPSLSSHPIQPPSAAGSSPATASLSTFMTVRSSAPRSAPSSSLVTLTSFATPQVMTSTLINTTPPIKPTRVADPTPLKPPAPPVRAQYGGPLTLSSTPGKPALEAGVLAGPLAREHFRATPTPPTIAPVTYSLPANLPFAPYDKPDSRNAPSSQSSSDKPLTYSVPTFPTGESRASLLVQAKPPSLMPAIISEMPLLPVTPSATALCAPSLITSDRNTQSFARPQVASTFSSTPAPVSSSKPPSIPAPVAPAAPPAAAARPAAVPVLASAPLPSSQTAATASVPLPSTTLPSALVITGPTLASKPPPLPIPPPFCAPTPVNSAISFTPPIPAPTPCPSAYRASAHATVIPGPVTPCPSLPHEENPAPAALTHSSITPTPALMTSAPASKPPVPAPVITSTIAPPTPSAPDTIATKPALTSVSIAVSVPKLSPLTANAAHGPGRIQASADPGPASLSGANDKGGLKPAEPPQTSLPGPVKDRRAPPGKLAGLSKIPVVGGGRGGKLPTREVHPPLHGGDGDRSPDPFTPGPTPASTPTATPMPTPEDERPALSPQDGRGRAGAGVPATRQPPHQDESQPAQRPQHQQPPRDSKIPVKHGPPPTSQPREPPRSKIPTSKVPVRRLGSNKPAATSTTALQNSLFSATTTYQDSLSFSCHL